jgi:hypothetical protein
MVESNKKNQNSDKVDVNFKDPTQIINADLEFVKFVPSFKHFGDMNPETKSYQVVSIIGT